KAAFDKPGTHTALSAKTRLQEGTAAAAPPDKPTESSGPLLEVVRMVGGGPAKLFSAIALEHC
ncbi:amino acid permease, partial [Streptomyces sp. NPDC055080]